MAFPPEGVGGAAPSSPPLGLIAGPGAGEGESADLVQQGVNDALTTIRELMNQVKTFGSQFPALAQETAQIQNAMRQMIVKIAQQASMQTPSSEAVPTSGM